MRRSKEQLINYLKRKYGFINIDDKVILFRNIHDMLWGTMVIERQPESGKIIVYGVPKKQKKNGVRTVSKFFEVIKAHGSGKL